jgi:hypothetical protein
VNYLDIGGNLRCNVLWWLCVEEHVFYQRLRIDEALGRPTSRTFKRSHASLKTLSVFAPLPFLRALWFSSVYLLKVKHDLKIAFPPIVHNLFAFYPSSPLAARSTFRFTFSLASNIDGRIMNKGGCWNGP